MGLPGTYRVMVFPHHEGAAAEASTSTVLPQAHLYVTVLAAGAEEPPLLQATKETDKTIAAARAAIHRARRFIMDSPSHQKGRPLL